jgi:hypothetical protein
MNKLSPIAASRPSTRSRYPGARPFSESSEDRQRFFGRDREGEQLYLRILSVPLLLQFAKSGLGKTSLLNAWLFPRLRRKPFLPVLVRFNEKHESPVEAFARSLRQACAFEGLEVPELRTEGLWELLSTAFVWRGDLLLTPVLVLDQFEEVFTLRDSAFRDKLAEELGAVVAGVPPDRSPFNDAGDPAGRASAPEVKIVISMREDYLGDLEDLSAVIPNLFQERLRLEPLSEAGARDAITSPALLPARPDEEPFWAPAFELEKPALDKMIDFLQGETGIIEPFTLQLLCRRAESIAHAKGWSDDDGPTRLTLADFAQGADFRQELKNFYRDALGRLESALGPAARANVEELCEHGLLDREHGRRLLLEEQQICDQFGVGAATLDMLVRERLVRRERREPSTFYEISHDRLAESIYASRRNKLPKFEREQLRKEEESERRWYRRTMLGLVGTAVATLLAVAATAGYFVYMARATNVAVRLSAGGNEALPIRERLLLLVAASEDYEDIGVRTAVESTRPRDGKPHAPDDLLRDILSRAPVLGAPGPAALDPDGTRLAYLSLPQASGSGAVTRGNADASKTAGLRIVDLRKDMAAPLALGAASAASDARPIDIPLAELSGAPMAHPIVGFVAGGAGFADTIVVSPSALTPAGSAAANPSGGRGLSCERGLADDGEAIEANAALMVGADRTPRRVALRLGEFGSEQPFPAQVDFGGGALRVTTTPFRGGLPRAMCVLAYRPAAGGADTQPATEASSASANASLVPEPGFPAKLDWDAASQQARRIPVLAADCDKFAFLGFPTDAAQADASFHPILYAGDFPGSAVKREIDVRVQPGTNAASSVAITRGCSAMIVRVSPPPRDDDPSPSDKVFVFPLDPSSPAGASPHVESPTAHDVPPALKGILLPSFPLGWPALAGTTLPRSKATRVAWLLEKGLAVVDLPKDAKAASPLSNDRPLLTGFEGMQGITRLIISRDGNFLLATWQKSFSSSPEFRLFDLRVRERRALLDKLDGNDLRAAACHTADFLRSARSEDDVLTLFGGGDPCRRL